jgi:hypothetical protein
VNAIVNRALWGHLHRCRSSSGWNLVAALFAYRWLVRSFIGRPCPATASSIAVAEGE